MPGKRIRNEYNWGQQSKMRYDDDTIKQNALESLYDITISDEEIVTI